MNIRTITRSHLLSDLALAASTLASRSMAVGLVGVWGQRYCGCLVRTARSLRLAHGQLLVLLLIRCYRQLRVVCMRLLDGLQARSCNHCSVPACRIWHVTFVPIWWHAHARVYRGGRLRHDTRLLDGHYVAAPFSPTCVHDIALQNSLFCRTTVRLWYTIYMRRTVQLQRDVNTM